MSISSELSRIQSAKESIKTAIRNKGVSLSGNEKLGDLATRIGQIQTGGSTGGQVFKTGYSTQAATGASCTISPGFVPQIVALIIKKSGTSSEFVAAYNAATGVVWQSNDSGGYHTYSTASVNVSNKSVTFNLKTAANNTLTTAGTVYWMAAGYV